jgi:hypoxanthine phosphoribosyltransferase
MMNTQPELTVLVSRRKIAAVVKRLAEEIRRDYEGLNPLVVGILKGSFVFLADLVRAIDMPLQVDFVKLTSYGSGTQSSGRITVLLDLNCQLEGRHVLVVEDIVDSGLTASFLCDYLRQKGPTSVKLCSFTSKPSRRVVDIKIDYLGLEVPDKFLVGYGLDCAEKYRYLPNLCELKEDNTCLPS